MSSFVDRCDGLFADIAAYVHDTKIESTEAYDTARIDLADSLGCAILAHGVPECARQLGPVVPGATVEPGARVPGVKEPLDPVTASFNLGMLIRWLDYNDTWLAAEWGHPSDNLGAILAVADYLSRGGAVKRAAPAGAAAGGGGAGTPAAYLTVRDVLTAMIKAHEIQGVLALDNSFNRVGLDHVLLVKIASAAVTAGLLGATKDRIAETVSNAFVDNGSLRTYRHFPNTGSRKSWAAGDAAARGVRLALMVLAGEPGYATAMTTPTWGFHDVVMKGGQVTLQRPLASYVMENVLFKVSFPAEFHGQTAVEAALRLHPEVAPRLDQVKKVVIKTQESGMRIINKTGPLHNPADRDHCIQYMTAVGLIHGELTADHYRDEAAADPRIDALRDVTEVVEEPRYSKDYLDPEKRSIGNSVQVLFTDGTETEEIAVEYPIGHRRRRDEAVPRIFDKFQNNLSTFYSPERVQRIRSLWDDADALDSMPVRELTDAFTPE
ncbi:MAG: bifunctional 2-methylcitrate dehydratase/aconitate hydratase [Spirochaetota bacterium]